LILVGLPLAACKEVEEEVEAGYVPAKLVEVEGSDVPRVSFTAEGARRTGLKTAPVRRIGAGKVIPYEALIYDPDGGAYVYEKAEPLSYLRVEIEVKRITGDAVLLEDGPPAGTRIVTVGAAEVHGAELEVAGS
jgi:hypothetical protein